jgi:hypothetical protein
MHRVLFPIAFALCAASAACAPLAPLPATPLQSAIPERGAARGPGAVFASAEEAALDALHSASLLSAREPAHRRRARGGTVFRVPGGFSYGPLAEASEHSPRRLRLAIEREPVACFHTRGYLSLRERQRLRSPSACDSARGERDSLRPPTYVLAQGRRVWRYAGAKREELIAQLPPRAPGRPTAAGLRLSGSLE